MFNAAIVGSGGIGAHHAKCYQSTKEIRPDGQAGYVALETFQAEAVAPAACEKVIPTAKNAKNAKTDLLVVTN